MSSRPCLEPGCPVLVSKAIGRCDQHRRQYERQRETAHVRGYTSAESSPWRAFRRRFLARLVELGIPPVCGSVLPNGPITTHSRCKKDGVWTFTSDDGSSLHFDHEPELTDAERAAVAHGDRTAFDDERRIQLLCAACHTARHATGGRSSLARPTPPKPTWP
jgi:hypothetical protein